MALSACCFAAARSCSIVCMAATRRDFSDSEMGLRRAATSLLERALSEAMAWRPRGVRERRVSRPSDGERSVRIRRDFLNWRTMRLR